MNIETIVEDLAAKIDFEIRGTSVAARNTFASITLIDQYSTQPSPQLIAQLFSVGADHVTLIGGQFCAKGHSYSQQTLCLRYLPAHAMATISADGDDFGAISASQVSLADALQLHVGRQISIEFLGSHNAHHGGRLISQVGEWIRTSVGLHSLMSMRAILVHDVLGQVDESHYC